VEARVEADSILAATEKAKQSDAYSELSEAERGNLTPPSTTCCWFTTHDDYLLIPRADRPSQPGHHEARRKYDERRDRGALRGTKI